MTIRDDIPSTEYLLQYLTDHGVRNARRADGRINVLEEFTINGVPGSQWRDIPATFAAVRAFLGY